MRGKPDGHTQKNEPDRRILPRAKSHADGIRGLSVRPETANLLEENKAGRSLTAALATTFGFDAKSKINKWDHIQLKGECRKFTRRLLQYSRAGTNLKQSREGRRGEGHGGSGSGTGRRKPPGRAPVLRASGRGAAGSGRAFSVLEFRRRARSRARMVTSGVTMRGVRPRGA